MKQKKNRGFTLVELIVASAILGVVSLAAAGFMSVSARTYSSVNYSLRLQYASQLAMAQLQEYLIDCNGGISWDGTDLYVVNRDPAAPDYAASGVLHRFRYDSATQCLYYGSGVPRGTVPAADSLLAEYVSAVSITLDDATDSVTVTLSFARQEKTYTAAQTLSLRNGPALDNSLDKILDRVYPVAPTP